MQQQQKQPNLLIKITSATSLLIIILLSLFQPTRALNIMMFTANINSHHIYFATLGSKLSKLGHRVELFMPSNAKVPSNIGKDAPNFTITLHPTRDREPYLNSERASDYLVKLMLSDSVLDRYLLKKRYYTEASESFSRDCRSFLEDKKLIGKILGSNFHFVIVDPISIECQLFFTEKLSVPFATFSIPHSVWINRVPRLNSFTPSAGMSATDTMSFLERLQAFAQDVLLTSLAGIGVESLFDFRWYRRFFENEGGEGGEDIDGGGVNGSSNGSGVNDGSNGSGVNDGSNGNGVNGSCFNGSNGSCVNDGSNGNGVNDGNNGSGVNGSNGSCVNDCSNYNCVNDVNNGNCVNDCSNGTGINDGCNGSGVNDGNNGSGVNGSCFNGSNGSCVNDGSNGNGVNDGNIGSGVNGSNGSCVNDCSNDNCVNDGNNGKCVNDVSNGNCVNDCSNGSGINDGCNGSGVNNGINVTGANCSNCSNSSCVNNGCNGSCVNDGSNGGDVNDGSNGNGFNDGINGSGGVNDDIKASIITTHYILDTSSLWFFLEDLSVTPPSANMPNTMSIGDIMGDQPLVELPSTLRRFIDQSSRPVILVSFGSYFDHLPEFIAEKLCATFKRINYRVVWKLKNANHNQNYCSDAENVIILPWIPQYSLLAEPRVRLFVSHGGLNSLIEAVKHAKPVIVFPFTVDQHTNAASVAEKGYGLAMDFKRFRPRELEENIERIIADDGSGKGGSGKGGNVSGKGGNDSGNFYERAERPRKLEENIERIITDDGGGNDGSGDSGKSGSSGKSGGSGKGGGFYEKAERYSAILTDKSLPAEVRVSHAIEHVVRYGSGHLRTGAYKLNHWQFLMFDIFLVLFLIVSVFLALTAWLVRACHKFFCPSKSAD